MQLLLKSARINAKLTQTQIAGKVDGRPTTVVAWEFRENGTEDNAI